MRRGRGRVRCIVVVFEGGRRGLVGRLLLLLMVGGWGCWTWVSGLCTR